MPLSIGYPKKRAQTSTMAREAVVDARTKLDKGKDHRQSKREKLWRQSEKQYDGEHWDTAKADPDSDRIVVNVSKSTVNTISPYTTGSTPTFIVEPHSGDATQLNAALQQALINRLWGIEEIRAQPSLARGGWDALVYGDGFCTAGFSLEERRVNGGEDYQEVASLYVERVSPWDVWIDPGADGIFNARWTARRFLITLAELKADKRYFNKQEDNLTVLSGDFTEDRERVSSPDYGTVNDGSEWVELFEFYDAVHRRILVFSADSSVPLRWIDDVPSHPLVQIANDTIPNSPWHAGILESVWDLQQELNKTRSQMITHRRRDVQKVLARKSALDAEAMEALRSPVVLEAILVDTDEPLNDVIQPLQSPALSVDVYNVAAIAKEDLYELTGVNEYQRGVTGGVRKTATESTILEGAANIKTQDKLRMVEDAARLLGVKLLHLARDVFPQTAYDEWQLYLTGREAERVRRNQKGADYADAQAGGAPQDALSAIRNQSTAEDVVVTPAQEMFTGEYEVTVEQSSTELRNPVMREQKAREMLMATVNMLPVLKQEGVQINVKRLYEMWLEAAGVDDIDAIFEVDQDQAMQGLAAALGGAIPQGGPGQQGPAGISPAAGGPNLAGAQPPSDLPSDRNSGLLSAVPAPA